MAKPVILAVGGDPQVPRADSGETALDVPGKGEPRGDSVTLDTRQGETCFVGRLRWRE